MYVINTVGTPLDQSFFCRGSLAESILTFFRIFGSPSCGVVVHRDSSSTGKLSELTFVAAYSQRQFNKLITDLSEHSGQP